MHTHTHTKTMHTEHNTKNRTNLIILRPNPTNRTSGPSHGRGQPTEGAERRPSGDREREAGDNPESRGKPTQAAAPKPLAIVEGFKGMAETVTDMCQFGLRKPAGEGARRFMKKPTRLVGTPEVIRRCSRRCKGSHKHTHIFGNFKWRGKWRSLSQFAGGYTPDFAQEVVIGAEEYLRGTRRPEIFVEEEDLEQRMLQEELMDVSREEEVPEEAQRQQKQTRDRLRLMMVHGSLDIRAPRPWRGCYGWREQMDSF